MSKLIFNLKTTVGEFEVSTVNLRGRDDWFETLIFDRLGNTIWDFSAQANSITEAVAKHESGVDWAKGLE